MESVLFFFIVKAKIIVTTALAVHEKNALSHTPSSCHIGVRINKKPTFFEIISAVNMKAISRLMLMPSPRTISSWKYLIASSIPKTTSKESA